MRLHSTKSSRVRATVLVATAALAVTTVLAGPAAAAPKPTGDVPAPVRDLTVVREIVPAEFGLANPMGVAWSDADQLLVVSGDDGQGTEAVALTPEGSLAGSIAVPTSSKSSTLAADDAGHGVIVDGPDVVEVVIDGTGVTRQPGAAPGAEHPRDATFDPTDDKLVVLDDSGNLITSRVDGRKGDTTKPSGVKRDTLGAVAYNAADGLTYVADTANDLLVGLDDEGNPVRSYGMADLGITSLQAMAFGPSGDPTDSEGRMSLFVVDAGAPGTNGVVMEATLAAVASTAPTVTAQLLRTRDLSQLNPTSPDPSGIVWMSNRSRLMISDGEVDEMPLYEGTNLYETTLTPTVSKRGTTVPWSNEPTGVGYNPANGHLFTSDDDKKRIFEVDDGADNVFGTADDVVTSFSSAAFGNTDPEDLTLDLATGDLYIVDGLGREVTRVSPGSNGVFDGVPPLGDDTWGHFDLEILGAMDPEGINYDPVRGTLLVIDDSAAKIFELARNGSLINAIDITSLNTQAAAGVAIAPRSSNASQRSYYVVDRGLDNNSHPTENDGLMFELSASLPAITNLPPLADAGPDSEIELPETATLSGSFSDDGKPTANVSAQWSVLSGPGPVSFANASAVATTAGFTTPGVYTLRLTVDDGDRPDIDDVTVTVVEAGGVHNSQFPVVVGTDDAEEAATGFVSVTSADLELVEDGTVNQTVGMRFANMHIPAGAVIENAFVQFQTDEALTSTGPTSLRIQGEATDNAATYQAVSKNITTRPKTTSSAFWNPDPWNVVFERGPAQRSSDVGRIVQEIVDRPGWSAGNALALMVSGTGRRTAEARDGTQAPVLQVGWRRPVAGANRAPLVGAGAAQQIQLPQTASLSGTVTDDGLPSSPGAVTASWTKVSGPGTVAFADASAAITSASFGEAGTYVLRLTGNDGALQSYDEVTVTVLAADAPQSTSITVAAGADDAEQALSGFMSTTNPDLELGVDGTTAQLVGLRYALPIPAGAIVDSATVRFTTDEVSTDNARLQIQAEAADDAAPFESVSGNLTNRTRAAGSVDWNAAPWPTVNASGVEQTTPNFASVLQRVVDRPGWAAGNHAAVLIGGTGRRTADALEDGHPAVINLTWHLPLDGANRVPVTDAGADQEVQLPGSAALAGTVVDDGLPTPPGTVTSTWTKVSGPGTVTFVDPAAPTTSAGFSDPGEYVLQLSADDGALQASDQLVVTVHPVDRPMGVTVPLASGADDAEQVLSGFMSTTNNDLELGFDGAAAQVVGLRYAIPVPAGAIVDSAVLRFTADEVSIDPAALDIQAEAADDAAAFQAVSRNLTDRTRTTASVPWAPAPWPTINVRGTDQTTPNFAAVVQEVVDRPGWAAGNNVAVLISGTGRRTADSFEDGPAAELVVDWHMPAPPTNTPPVVGAGADQAVERPASATLAGTVTDDGLPASPGAVATTWTTTSGPGTVTFTDAAAAATSASFDAAGVYVLRLTATDGSLEAFDEVTVTVTDPVPVALGRELDYNGDGHPDILASDSSNVLWLYPGNGSGGLGARVQMATGWTGINAVIGAGDLNSDDHADVLGRDTSGRLWFYPGDGTGGLGARTQVGTGWGSLTGFGAGDVDGDGTADILARDGNQLWLYPGDGSGGLGARSLRLSGFNVTAPTGIGDRTADGLVDVVGRDSQGRLWMYPGTATGFGDRVQLATGWTSNNAMVGTGDADGDGRPDVVARDILGRLWFYPGTATGLGARSEVGTGFIAMTLIS
ncbi:MAG: hypothetical protein GEU96_06020 [Propionibacteriales bacterium]|nr:hypothetical protein [Propionibacteriales bacterium]